MLVFDASTLILTAKIELLDLFLDNVGMEVAIPQAVKEECCGGRKTLDGLIVQKAVRESRITVKTVRNRKLVAKLEEDFKMGRGESEAIALALQDRALLVGIDDKRGINACKLTGIPFTTAADILVRSRQKGLIDQSDALYRLSALAGHGRYRNSILEDAKRRLEEQPWPRP
jgi:predicted nucleic acid-binding protein